MNEEQKKEVHRQLLMNKELGHIDSTLEDALIEMMEDIEHTAEIRGRKLERELIVTTLYDATKIHNYLTVEICNKVVKLILNFDSSYPDMAQETLQSDVEELQKIRDLEVKDHWDDGESPRAIESIQKNVQEFIDRCQKAQQLIEDGVEPEEFDLRYCPHCHRMVNSIKKESYDTI